jgi:hypothetical protein
MRGSLNCRFLFAITVGYGLYKAINGSRAASASVLAMQAKEIKMAEAVTRMVD